MKPSPLSFLVGAALLLAGSAPVQAAEDRSERTFVLELEAGPVWQTVNDVRIPNDATASRFSLVDLVGKEGPTAGRGYLTWRINERHSLRGLYAPLTLDESGVPAGDLAFNGADYVGGRRIDATYKFNSYRLTYRYLWRDGAAWRWHIGFTAKIRDAKVQLVQGAVDSTKDDVGFVPLLHVAGRYQPGDRWYLNLDLDALAGGPGRAEDLALKIGCHLSPAVAWEAGYRMVEGGADVDAVYSFAWLHYAVVSLRIEI